MIQWPTEGLVHDNIKKLVDFISSHMKIADTYLTFIVDQYYDKNIKEITRTSRAGKHASREHQLSLLTPLPPQETTSGDLPHSVEE